MSTYTTDYDETVTITHRIGIYGDEQDEYQIVEARDETGTVVSELYADLITGQIMQVETIKSRRREGIAAALVAHAQAEGITLYHSPSEHRTREGNGWADSVDLDTISDELAYAA